MRCRNFIKFVLTVRYGILSLHCNAESWQQFYLNLLVLIPNIEKEIPSMWSCFQDISEITIPTGIISIGSHAFMGCKELNSVTISNSVVSIDSMAFSECQNLTSITIPKSVKCIGDSAFAECINLVSVVILNSEISIGADVFFGCEKLSQITLPAELVNNFLQKLEDYGLANVWEICEEKDGMVVLVRKTKY